MGLGVGGQQRAARHLFLLLHGARHRPARPAGAVELDRAARGHAQPQRAADGAPRSGCAGAAARRAFRADRCDRNAGERTRRRPRSEEHTSELQSLMRTSYAVFCLKTKKSKTNTYIITKTTKV